jgi:hypothetical protein
MNWRTSSATSCKSSTFNCRKSAGEFISDKNLILFRLIPYPNFAFYSDSGQKLNAEAGFGFSPSGFRLFIFLNPRRFNLNQKPKPKAENRFFFTILYADRQKTFDQTAFSRVKCCEKRIA